MAVLVPDEANLPVSGRRRVLGVVGACGLSFALGTAPAPAFFFRRSASLPELDVSAFPETWVERQGGDLKGYADFLGDLRLKRITVQQVIEAHAKRRGSVWNMLPPRSLWKQMGPTLKAVDRIAQDLGQPPSEIVSAYRSPSYNARCSGARRGSWHQANVAIDVKFPVRAATVTGLARHLRSRGLFCGGIGGYYSFTHIDTRGKNVDW